MVWTYPRFSVAKRVLVRIRLFDESTVDFIIFIRIPDPSLTAAVGVFTAVETAAAVQKKS